MCKHNDKDKSAECFVNAPHIKFKRCKKCGEDEYPPNFYPFVMGKTTEYLWPL